MKTIRKTILKFWFYFFPKQVIKDINQTLLEAKKQRDQEAGLLLIEIRNYMQKEFRITEASKYIPLKIKYKAVQSIQKIYGKQLRDVRLKVTNELRFVRA